MTTISVIIPAYNQGLYLGQTIQSVLDQSFQDFEIVVVDDGSTDHTAEVAKSFNDLRINYVYQENRGLSGARNTGIRKASGDFLTFLDSDDLFLPGKLAHLLAELENKPDIGLTAGQAIPINEQGEQVGKIFDKPLPEDPTRLLLGNPLHVGSVLLRRDWQEKVGFFDETLRSYEDWDMWLRLALAGCKMSSVPKPVSLYRFHTAQMTRIGTQMTTATFAVLDKLFNQATLPENWLVRHDTAYSNAYLRAAAQAYHAKDFSNAKSHMSKAVELNLDLISDHARPLAERLASWIELPKASNPVAYLEDIYNNLPDNVSELGERRREDLGRAAMQITFEAYHRGDMIQTRYASRRALYYEPRCFGNRGVLSIFIRSHLPFFINKI